MRKYLVVFLAGIILTPGLALAAGFTDSQVSALVGLLRAFGVDETTISQIEGELTAPIIASAPQAQPQLPQDVPTSSPAPTPPLPTATITSMQPPFAITATAASQIYTNASNQAIATLAITFNQPTTVKGSEAQIEQLFGISAPGHTLQLLYTNGTKPQYKNGPAGQGIIANETIKLKVGDVMRVQVRLMDPIATPGTLELNLGDGSETSIEVVDAE